MADLTSTLDESFAAHLLHFKLPVLGMEALGSTNAVADEGLIVCACVPGLWLDGCACKGACSSNIM